MNESLVKNVFAFRKKNPFWDAESSQIKKHAGKYIDLVLSR